MTDADNEQRYYYSGELPAHTTVYNRHGEQVTIEYARSFKTDDAFLIMEVFPALVEAGVLSMTPPKKG